MEPSPTDPDVTPAASHFRAERERSHALLAIVAVGVFWLGHVLFVRHAVDSATRTELLSLPWFGWWILGLSAVPAAMRALDEALARARGDQRPLHRPYATFLAALLGSVAWFVLVLVLSGFLPARSPVLDLFRSSGVVFSAMGIGAVLGAWTLTRRCAPLEVTVGADAVRCVIGRRTTVVPLRDVIEVQRAPLQLTLRRRGGRALVMDLHETDLGEWPLFDALQTAVERARRPVPYASALRRGAQSLDAWRDDLRAKGMGLDGLRGPHLDASTLAEIIAHPGSSNEERIGAAIALRTNEDGGGARVRIAAEPVMDPATRRALDAIAEGEESPAVLERALRGDPGARPTRLG